VTLVMVLLTIAVVGGVSAVVAGVVSGGLGEPSAPIPVRALPAGPLTGEDVAGLRFVQGLRGYRMDQVDAAMDQLAHEIERLRRLVPADADQGLNGSLPPLPAREATFDTVLAEPEAGGATVPAEAEADARADGTAQEDRTFEDDEATSGAAVDGVPGERARLPSDLPTGRD